MNGRGRTLTVDRTIVSNAVSLFGATAATAGLGFAYSLIADRLFGKAAFGLAQAGVSAMMLLSGLGLLGLTTLLVGELPRRRPRAPGLLTAALLASAVAGGVLGALFCLVAPLAVPELGALVHGGMGSALFTLGVIFTTVTQVFDYAMVGLLRTSVQLWRNIIASSARVAALFVAVFFHGPLQVVALLIFSTWTLGHLVSLLVVGAALRRRGERIAHRPDWPLLGALSGSALRHHALNIAWQAPVWVFPLIVTAFLGASANASFYVAWMMFFLVYKITESLTTVLYAVNAADVSLLAQKMRFTLRTAVALSALACALVMPLAPFALHIFGAAYAAEATGALRVLVLTVFPLIVKMHFLAVMQVSRRIGRASVLMAVGALLEVGGAALGAALGQGSALGGMTGLCLGMLAGQCLEAGLMLPVVVQTLTPPRAAAGAILPQPSSTP